MSRRDEYDEYRGDVIYETWMRGGNVDAVDYDRVSDYYYDGIEAERAAQIEMERQYRKYQEAEAEKGAEG